MDSYLESDPLGMTYRVQAPSRLHFGLLSLPSNEDRWPDLQDRRLIAARSFGGVGLMISRPGVSIAVEPSEQWSASGPLAERALIFAKQSLSSLNAVNLPTAFGIKVETAAKEHVGLGTGTQLGLSVARAVAVACGIHEIDTVKLAASVGRGRRSAIGVHGFVQGGFLVDGGKRTGEIAPLVCRHAFPGSWRIVLIVPRSERGVHGSAERLAFSESLRGSLRQTEALSRLLLLGLIPSLVEEDLPAFGEALYDYNRRVGEMFRAVQGGIYSHPRSEEIVSFVRACQVGAIGQSSWGPTLFAITEAERAEHLAESVLKRFGFTAEEVFVTEACRNGAACSSP